MTGGGLPISAVVGPSQVMDHATAFSKQTLHGNPVCASAARAVLRTIDDDGLVAKASDIGDYLLGRLGALMNSHPLVGDVRAAGWQSVSSWFVIARCASGREADDAVAILGQALADVEAGQVPDEAIDGFEGW